MKTLKVGFLSAQNCLDRSAFSGILYYMQLALKQRDLQIVYLGGARKYSHWEQFVSRAWWRFVCLVWINKGIVKKGSPRHNQQRKKFAYKVQKQLARTPCDVVFAPVAGGELTFLETNVPIVYLSDVTFKLLQEYYSLNLDQQEIEWETKKELTAILKSTRLIYSSDWAAKSAVQDYHAEIDKVSVIPFGANLDRSPSEDEILLKKQTLKCCLLFIGKDWNRKGGNIAFQTLLSLEEMGIDAELTVVGTVPPNKVRHRNLIVIPYLNKNIPEQRDQLNELYLKSNFFIFPTRADCSPIVICEANAFGLPVITTEVGGIPSIIKNKKNGYMLSLSASGKEYATLIAKIFLDQVLYQNLVISSREEYNLRLNWDCWAESVHKVMLSVIQGGDRSPIS